MTRRAAIDREMIRRHGLKEFVRRAWPKVDTSPLVWSWPLDAVCEHLEAVQRREIRDLVVNIPPGLGKSLLVSVLFPAWVWTFDPEHRWIAASYADSVSLRDARKCRTLLESDWYQACWPDVRLPRDRTASVAVSLYANTLGGQRYTTTVRGAVTGQHSDTALVDDPMDPSGATAASGLELQEVLDWWHHKMSTRFRDPPRSARILVMQRLHTQDLSGDMIASGATVLCLPMRFEARHPHRHSKDPRTAEGELLAPQRYPEAEVGRLETELGPSAAAAQLQQRPAPKGGGILKEAWFKLWTELPPAGVYSFSIDCAFKETATSSYVVLQVWYAHGPNHYLVDQLRERMDFARTILAIVAWSIKYPRAHKKLVESKANGPAVVSVLKTEISGLIEVEPDGGKEARAYAAQPLVFAGNVFVPHPEHATYPDGRKGAPWVTKDFFPEVTVFPRAATDDQVDALTQYLNSAAPSYLDKLRAATDKLLPRKTP